MEFEGLNSVERAYPVNPSTGTIRDPSITTPETAQAKNVIIVQLDRGEYISREQRTRNGEAPLYPNSKDSERAKDWHREDMVYSIVRKDHESSNSSKPVGFVDINGFGTAEDRDRRWKLEATMQLLGAHTSQGDNDRPTLPREEGRGYAVMTRGMGNYVNNGPYAIPSGTDLAFMLPTPSDRNGLGVGNRPPVNVRGVVSDRITPWIVPASVLERLTPDTVREIFVANMTEVAEEEFKSLPIVESATVLQAQMLFSSALGVTVALMSGMVDLRAETAQKFRMVAAVGSSNYWSEFLFKTMIAFGMDRVGMRSEELGVSWGGFLGEEMRDYDITALPPDGIGDRIPVRELLARMMAADEQDPGFRFHPNRPKDNTDEDILKKSVGDAQRNFIPSIFLAVRLYNQHIKSRTWGKSIRAVNKSGGHLRYWMGE